MDQTDAPLSRLGEGLADRKAGYSPDLERDAMDQQQLASATLTSRIKRACDSTPPRSSARRRALARVRWVLRDGLGGYAARVGSIADGCVVSASDVKDAIVFDGRDNEEAKARYYEAITGLKYTVELI